MNLTMTVAGSVLDLIQKEIKAGEKAVSTAMRGASSGLKETLRAQVRSAGMGNRLANTWRNKVYPVVGDSMKAAGVVFTTAPHIMNGLEASVTIRGKDGLWLAIPTENAPKRGVGGKRISPTTFPEHTMGKLRFVYRRGKVSFLVVDNARARINRQTGALRGYRMATEKQRGKGKNLTTVVMFLMVPQVRTRKRLDVAGAARQWQAKVPDMILQQWKERP